MSARLYFSVIFLIVGVAANPHSYGNRIDEYVPIVLWHGMGKDNAKYFVGLC